MAGDECDFLNLYRFSGDIAPMLENKTLTQIYLEEGYGFSRTAAADITAVAVDAEEYTADAVYDTLVSTFFADEDADDTDLSTYMENMHDALSR
jgi:hypothetical protein